MGHVYHGVCERRRHRDRHPPDQTPQEVPPFPSDQTADELAIQLSHIQANHGPQHQKDAMANQQPKLLALPPRYAYPQQPQQVLEELAIELDLLPARSFAFALGRRRLAVGGGTLGRGLLFGNGIADAVDEGDEEGEVDGAGYARAVLEVQAGEVVHDGRGRGAGEARPRGRELGEDGHGDGSIAAARSVIGDLGHVLGVWMQGGAHCQ